MDRLYGVQEPGRVIDCREENLSEDDDMGSPPSVWREGERPFCPSVVNRFRGDNWALPWVFWPTHCYYIHPEHLHSIFTVLDGHHP